MIRNAIFDVANVIVDWEPSRPLRGVLPDDQIDSFLTSKEFWEINAAVDAGLSLAEASERVDRELPEQGHAYRVYQERFPMTVSGPVPGTEDVIDELLAAGVPTFGLSNWAAENFSVAREAAPGIGRLADVIVSGEVGLAKPDEAIFRLALERFGLEASETVMIDDTVVNLDAAARVGLATIHFTSAEQLRADLVGLSLL